MKLRLLPFALTTVVAVPGMAVASGPTLYGKMNVTYEMVEDETTFSSLPSGAFSEPVNVDQWELNSNASRIGVKGSEAVTDNLNVIYQAEYGIDVDDSGSSPFSQRDIFVGLQGGWGTFKVGKFDSALKSSQGKVDQFNDMQFGDISNVIAGDNRVGNLLQYSTPAIAEAITINIGFQPGEDAENNGDDGPADNFSVSLVFSTDAFYAAIAQDDGINGVDATRLTGQLMLGAFEVGAIYSMAEDSEDADAFDQTGFILSGGLKLGESGKLRAQYGMSEDDANEGEITQYGFGYDHSLSKQTKLFVNYIYIEEEEEGTFDFGGLVGEVGALAETEGSTLQFGIEHKF